MKKVKIFNKVDGKNNSVGAQSGDVKTGGDAWTLLTNILRYRNEKRWFTLGISKLGSDDRLKQTFEWFTLGISRLGSRDRMKRKYEQTQ